MSRSFRSARVSPPRRKFKLGRFRIPLTSPAIGLRRKSKPFWAILGEHGIGCTILCVPITFPPEKFDGRILSAMCTPDLKGTQGSFSQFSTRIGSATFESGSRYPLHRTAEHFEGSIEVPGDAFLDSPVPLQIPFRIRMTSITSVRLEISEEVHDLRVGGCWSSGRTARNRCHQIRYGWRRLMLHGPKGICAQWEQRRIPGDSEIVQRIWEQNVGLAHLFIWHVLLSF